MGLVCGVFFVLLLLLFFSIKQLKIYIYFIMATRQTHLLWYVNTYMYVENNLHAWRICYIIYLQFWHNPRYSSSDYSPNTIIFFHLEVTSTFLPQWKFSKVETCMKPASFTPCTFSSAPFLYKTYILNNFEGTIQMQSLITRGRTSSSQKSQQSSHCESPFNVLALNEPDVLKHVSLS